MRIRLKMRIQITKQLTLILITQGALRLTICDQYLSGESSLTVHLDSKWERL